MIRISPLYIPIATIDQAIGMFTAGNTPTDAPVPIGSLAFIAAELLLWFGTAIGQRP